MIQPYAVDELNRALQEFYNWCLNNRLTPHPRKSKVILFSKRTLMGPITPVYPGSSGHQDKTVRSDSRPEIHLGGQRAGNKEKFCQKLDLLKCSPFLPRAISKDVYFKVTLPAVKYSLVL